MRGFRVLLLVGLASQCCLVSAEEFVATIPFTFQLESAKDLAVTFPTDNTFAGGSLTFYVGYENAYPVSSTCR